MGRRLLSLCPRVPDRWLHHGSACHQRSMRLQCLAMTVERRFTAHHTRLCSSTRPLLPQASSLRCRRCSSRWSGALPAAREASYHSHSGLGGRLHPRVLSILPPGLASSAPAGSTSAGPSSWRRGRAAPCSCAWALRWLPRTGCGSRRTRGTPAEQRRPARQQWHDGTLGAGCCYVPYSIATLLIGVLPQVSSYRPACLVYSALPTSLPSSQMFAHTAQAPTCHHAITDVHTCTFPHVKKTAYWTGDGSDRSEKGIVLNRACT